MPRYKRKRGLKREKHIYMKTKQEKPVDTEAETARRRKRLEDAKAASPVELGQKGKNNTAPYSSDESSGDRIEEGRALASDGDVVLPSEKVRVDSWDAQLAVLISRGLLDDYEAEEADFTLNSVLRANEPLFSVKHSRKGKRKSGRRDDNLGKGAGHAWDWHIISLPHDEDDDFDSWSVIEV